MILVGGGGGGSLVATGRAKKMKNKILGIETDGDTFVLEVDGEKLWYKELKSKDLTLDYKIGEGAYGVVFRGKWRQVEIACKQLNRIKLEPKALLDFRREAHVMTRLGNHPNVVQFIGAVTEGDHLSLVTEFMERGSLEGILMDKSIYISHYMTVKFARDAASGILHLHSDGVVHRDIASRNCLIGEDWNLVVSDFGTSRFFEEEGQDVGQTASQVGPIRWMAPESIRDRAYSKMSDCWAYGVLAFEIASREKPFHNELVYDIMMDIVRDGRHVEIPDQCDDALKHIMESVFKTEPEERMDMDEIHDLLNARLLELEKMGLLDMPIEAIRAREEAERKRRMAMGLPAEAPESETNTMTDATSQMGGNYADAGALAASTQPEGAEGYMIPSPFDETSGLSASQPGDMYGDASKVPSNAEPQGDSMYGDASMVPSGGEDANAMYGDASMVPNGGDPNAMYGDASMVPSGGVDSQYIALQ